MLQATRKPLTWMAAAALLALPALADAGDAGEEDIPITDPALLERLGYEPDAGNVYATPQAYRELSMDPAERAALQEAWLAEHDAAQESSPAGGPFGTGTVGFSPVAGSEFLPFGSDAGYRYNDGIGRYCLNPSPWDGMVAQISGLPHGAEIENVRVWYWDNSDDALNVHIRSVCHPDSSAGAEDITVLGTFESTFAPGHGTAVLGPLAETIDLQSCVYEVLVNTGIDSGCPGDTSLAISKARAQWRRQVSPAPATATFDDVPTSHLFFQQIEALAASGVTGGCGDGNFCPNASLTRGQMAAFLAKALGLHWGEIPQD